jgi:hypothetical protein
MTTKTIKLSKKYQENIQDFKKEQEAKRLKKEDKAAKRKAETDQKAAMSEWGKYKKRTAQAKGCPSGQDFDHDLNRCISVNANRKKNSRSGSTQRKHNH